MCINSDELSMELMDTFETVGLAPVLVRAVTEMGYKCMTPIQQRAVPAVMQDRDVMGVAQTGTGKTAAFGLPLLHRLLKHENVSASPARHPVRALILLPTRELADQVAKQIQLFAKFTELRSAVVFGGVDIKPQIAQLKEGVEVLVATPGRLLDHLEGKSVLLNQVEYVVLDEADRMLDIGFLPDLQRILTYLQKQRTTLLFSATFSTDIKKLAESYLQNPIMIEVAKVNATASTITQRFVRVTDEGKHEALLQILQHHEDAQAFLFVNSKAACSRLARFLEKRGISVGSLHGDKTQEDRLRTLNAFKEGSYRLLVCTDVAARGLDIKDVPIVFNVDLPFNADDYIHRIGRTGRAGADGLAISFVGDGSDNKLLADIEKLTKQKAVLENLTAPKNESSKSSPHRFNGGQRPYQETGDKIRSWKRGQYTTQDRHPAKSLLDDPLFSQPYEPTIPSNDATSKVVNNQLTQTHWTKSRRTKNIRSKNAVPALLRSFSEMPT